MSLRCRYCGSSEHAPEACAELCYEIGGSHPSGPVLLCGLQIGHTGAHDFTVRALACSRGGARGTDHLSRAVASRSPARA